MPGGVETQLGSKARVPAREQLHALLHINEYVGIDLRLRSLGGGVVRVERRIQEVEARFPTVPEAHVKGRIPRTCRAAQM